MSVHGVLTLAFAIAFTLLVLRGVNIWDAWRVSDNSVLFRFLPPTRIMTPIIINHDNNKDHFIG